MPLHLIKLAVGIEDVAHLARAQHARIDPSDQGARGARDDGKLVHVTRQMPKRADEILDGGSIYWVIRGAVQARQRLLALEKTITEDGRPACALVLDPDLREVEPRSFRAFQGWRYLEATSAPRDLRRGGVGAAGGEPMPVDMARALRDLGLL